MICEGSGEMAVPQIPQAGPAPEDASLFQQIAKSWKVAFRSELTRTYAPTLPGGVGDLDKAADDAWRRQDWAGFIAATGALKAVGAMRPKRAIRFAEALFNAERLGEALEVLQDPALGSDDELGWTWLKALVWARLDEVAKAEAALESCAGAAQAGDAAERIGTLRLALAIRRRTAWPASWAEASALVFALLELRAPELASAVIAAYLEREGENALADIDPIADCCFAVLRLARAGPSRNLLSAMAPLYDALGEREAFASALAAMDDAAGDQPSPPASDAATVQALHNCLAAGLGANGRWRAAARRYVLDAQVFRRSPQVMCELSRCIGRDVTASLDLDLRPPQGGRRRVFDVFPFNGEFEMLELKLAAMADWVDGFVVVEAASSFTGRPKPLSFPARAADFAHLGDKLVYVPVETFPAYLTSAWAREFYQRDQGALGLRGRCSPEDVVIISDVDEIVRPEALAQITGPLAGADIRTFVYFLNYEQLLPRPNAKPIFARAGLLAHHGSSYLRVAARQLYKHSYVPDAGWHFSNIASPEALERKFRSFSHQEWGHLDRAHFEALLGKLRSTGLGPGFRRLDLDALPEFIRQRADALAPWLL